MPTPSSRTASASTGRAPRPTAYSSTSSHPSKSIKILQFNCNGLKSKLPEILHRADELSVDIICLQETNLSPTCQTPKCHGWSVARLDRTVTRQGAVIANAARNNGGVITLVKKFALPLKLSPTPLVQTTFCSLVSISIPLLVFRSQMSTSPTFAIRRRIPGSLTLTRPRFHPPKTPSFVAISMRIILLGTLSATQQRLVPPFMTGLPRSAFLAPTTGKQRE